jgi:malate dehydrogenase (oxaloacetate-decarboxylating)
MEHDGNSCQGTPKEIKTSLSGFALLFNPTLNKGSSFTDEERKAFGLEAMLPIAVNSLDQQTNRAWQQMNELSTKLQKNNFLQTMHDQNEVLFYNILVQHLGDLLDIIYTPTEGEWIEK